MLFWLLGMVLKLYNIILLITGWSRTLGEPIGVTKAISRLSEALDIVVLDFISTLYPYVIEI